MAESVLLPSPQARCHTGCEEEPRVSWKERVYDQELIYARFIIGLFASSREINFNDVLAFELAAYPPSMFNVDGNMNVATSKSTLKHKLLVTISERNCPISDTMLYDLFAFSGLSPGRLVNCVSTWTPLRHSSIKLYDAQMSSPCLIGTSPTASRHSRGRRDQDQVASIN